MASLTRSAFGLGFRGDGLAGLHDHPGPHRVVDVSQLDEAGLAARWAAAPAPVMLHAKRFDTGEPFLTVELSPEAGYRVWARDLGLHLVSAAGDAVWTWSSPATPWLARKFVAAQLLPLLAVLNGIEILHAAAVEVDGHVLALTAPSGTGKTSTAAQLIAGGAGFVADDGLALEPQGEGVIAHAGPRTLNLAAEQLAAVPPEQRDRLGEELGRSAIGESVEVHLEPPGSGGSAPLAAVMRLERTDERFGTIDPVERPAALILGSSHAHYLATPQRQLRQLEVVSSILSTVPVVQVTIGSEEPAERIAERVREWVRGR
jgi:hypothetical protein